MKVVIYSEIEKEICRLAKKWGVSFHFDYDEFFEVAHTAPWLNEEFLGEEFLNIKLDRGGILLFDTESEARAIYNKTLLDEAEKGETGVYACLIDPNGCCLTENT